MCGAALFRASTGELAQVACPSRFCAGMVPVVDGRIADHSPIMPNPQPCPWAGIRVVDDRADHALNAIGVMLHE